MQQTGHEHNDKQQRRHTQQAKHTKEETMTERTVVLKPKWYTTAQVAELLGYGLSKTKMLIAQRDIRSLKDGHNRRVLPEWVD